MVPCEGGPLSGRTFSPGAGRAATFLRPFGAWDLTLGMLTVVLHHRIFFFFILAFFMAVVYIY